MRQRRAFVVARRGVEVESEVLARDELDLFFAKGADAELGSLHVSHDADRPPDALLDRPDRLADRAMVFLLAMTEIQAEDIDPGSKKRLDLVCRVAGRADGGHDFRAALTSHFFLSTRTEHKY